MPSRQEWATAARKEIQQSTSDLDNKQEDFKAVEVIKSFLHGEFSAFRAAHRIAGIYEPRLKTRQRGDVEALWGHISQAAKSIDEAASLKLAGLMASLQGQPDVVDTSGKAVGCGNQVLWRDLPNWGRVFWEYGIDIDPPDGNDAEWHAQAPQLLNATIFAATLMAKTNNKPNMYLHASIAMVEALEKPYDETRESKEEWRMYIPPAATWIPIAGMMIRKFCFMEMLPDDVNQHVIRARWGGRTFCPERWTFWKERFLELSKDGGIDERCRQFAIEAVEAMEELDATE
ncbi:hypothetical protein D6D01_04667 [Aureobasidium pullulans]|uniref:Uncharacterized protein n=1 Tax=Aureobasidium pullulans TaxID=5580 RepID=A0A4S9LB24_AURPU|nr:hypothetical protein D6D01_04667 [Aureobasidium pullulans]